MIRRTVLAQKSAANVPLLTRVGGKQCSYPFTGDTAFVDFFQLTFGNISTEYIAIAAFATHVEYVAKMSETDRTRPNRQRVLRNAYL